MRLHKLVLRAFGPFPGTEVVDFDALADAGLFLLHGETGAGKTSVLDAVGFALYGVLPGARGTARLRSDHAAPDATPEVSLELTVRGRRLVVTRTPAHARAKRRGGGTTEVAASARLEEVTPEGHTTLGTRAQEVGHELGALLPLTAEQFFQVVLLPQGEFARFLRADAQARAALLSTLFRIERFTQVEGWFAARRAAAREAVERAERRVELVVARVAQVAGVTLGDPCGPDVAGGQGGADGQDSPGEPRDSAWLARLRAEAERRRDAATGRTVEAEVRLRAREAERDREADLARRQERRRAVAARAVELARQDEAVAVDERRFGNAERAAPVVPVLVAAEDTRRDAHVAAAAATAALAALARAATDGTAQPDVAGLRATVTRLREEVGSLRGLLPLADRVEADLRRAVQAERRAEEAEARARVAAEALAVLPARRRERESALAQAREAAVSLEGLRSRSAAARGLAEAAAALTPARARLTSAEKDRLAAWDTALRAQAHHQDLRERRIDGMRAELAGALEAGTPCPVCGALDHPEPAELPPDHVDREAERRARDEAERCGRAHDAARERVREAERAVEGLRGRLAAAGEEGLVGTAVPVPSQAPADTDTDTAAAPHPDPDPTALATAADELAGRVRDAERVARGLEAATAACADLDVAAEELRGRAAAAERDAVAARAEAGAARDAAAEGVQTLDRARGDDADVAARATRLGRWADAAARAADALTAAGEADRRAARAAEDALEAARAAGFADPADVAAARLGPAEREALRARLTDHRRQVAEVDGLLADDDLAVPLDPPADPAAAGRRAAAAEAELRAARDQAVEAGCRAAELASLAGELLAAEEELRPARAQGEEVRAIADLVGGLAGNELRMTLSSFVLAARLEEVAAAASLRLERMTSGRYTLIHDDSLASRGRRSGLGLRVRDAWTGHERDTATLSGGETFLASLALALGLAEVVTSEAGGARLDTLFVDEGFGTLDPEALDQVLEVLDGLRDGGRTVGVVSHVAELRQRIPVGLRISRGRAGSSLALVAAD